MPVIGYRWKEGRREKLKLILQHELNTRGIAEFTDVHAMLEVARRCPECRAPRPYHARIVEQVEPLKALDLDAPMQSVTVKYRECPMAPKP